MAPSGIRRLAAERPLDEPLDADASERGGAGGTGGIPRPRAHGRAGAWEDLAAEFPRLIKPEIDLVDELEQILRADLADPTAHTLPPSSEWPDGPAIEAPPEWLPGAGLPSAADTDGFLADETDTFDDAPAILTEAGFWRLEDAPATEEPADRRRGGRRFDIAVIGALVVLIASAGAYSALRGFGPGPKAAPIVSGAAATTDLGSPALARAEIGPVGLAPPAATPAIDPPPFVEVAPPPETPPAEAPVPTAIVPATTPPTDVLPLAVVPADAVAAEGIAIQRVEPEPPAVVAVVPAPEPTNPPAPTAADPANGIGGPFVAVPAPAPDAVTPAPEALAVAPAPEALAATPAPEAVAVAPAPIADPPIAAAPAGATGRTVATATTWVNMRAGPDNAATVIAVVGQGATVEVLRCNYWCEVIFNGRTGWIYQDFLRGAPRNPP